MNDNELTEKVFAAIYPKSLYADAVYTSNLIKEALPTLRALFRPQLTVEEIIKATEGLSQLNGGILYCGCAIELCVRLGLYTPPLSPGQQFVARINARLKAQQSCEAGAAFAEAIAAEYEIEMKEREVGK